MLAAALIMPLVKITTMAKNVRAADTGCCKVAANIVALGTVAKAMLKSGANQRDHQPER